MFIMKAFLAVLTAAMMLFGEVIGANNWDTISKYKKNVEAAGVYENTFDTAKPQTEIYDIISEFYAAPLPQGKTEKKVIVLGYDGCRADTFSLLEDGKNSAVNTLVDDGGHAWLSYCGGKNYPLFNTQQTSTAPGWCSMLTGRWADETGIKGNGQPKSNDYLSLLTTLVEDKTVNGSAFYVSWGGHFTDEDSTYINERKYCEDKNLNVIFSKADSDDGTYNNVMTDVTSDNCSDFIFSIFEFCDHSGHDTGFNLKNEDYVKAFADNDAACNNIISAIKARSTYNTEDWLIILTSDHGGYNLAHGTFTMQERYTFIVTNRDI